MGVTIEELMDELNRIECKRYSLSEGHPEIQFLNQCVEKIKNAINILER